MKILITNDDGFDAPGLHALGEAARRFGHVVAVAPTMALSGCSHRVTASNPLTLKEIESDWYSLDGTPADCVRIGLSHVLPDADWVLSGINHGGNLGADVYHSGTVAAVREAVLMQRPGIAFSHYKRRGISIDWERSERWIIPLLRTAFNSVVESGVYWNVNLPHLDAQAADPAVRDSFLQSGALPVSYLRDANTFIYDGDYHTRSRDSGSDVDHCFGGDISITRLVLPRA